MGGRTILVIEQFAEQYRARILAAFPEVTVRAMARNEDVGEAIAGAHALFGFGPSFDDGLIRRAVKLEWIQFLSSGTDTLARLPSLGRGVIVTSTHGVHGPPVSEMAFLHMLVLARQYARMRRNQAAEVWDEFDQVLLHRKTAVIVGTGLIAAELARRCKAFGMQVVGVTRTPRPQADFDRMVPRTEIRAAASEADFLVLLVPLTPETTAMIDASVLGAMKPTSILINVGRGAICDESALVAALRERRIGGAGLDAFCVEPLPKGHPFWQLENVSITPHVAGRSDRYSDLVMPILLHNLECHLAGRVSQMMNVKRAP